MCQKTMTKFTAFLLLIMLTACTPTTAQRGNMLEDYQIKQIAPGVHGKTDVLKLLGSPTTHSRRLRRRS